MAIAAGIALGMAVYAPALTSFFHADDFVLLEKTGGGGPWALWSHAPATFLRPVVSLTICADLAVWGRNPFGFHLFNVVLHLANALLVAALARRLPAALRERWEPAHARTASLIAGFVFLLQPFHAEAVSWVSGRTDVVAAFFCLVTLNAYLRFRGKPPSGRPWLSLAMASCVAALFAKESALTLPLALLLFEAVRVASEDREAMHGRGFLRRLAASPAAAFFLTLPPYFLIRHALLGVWVGGYGSAQTHLSLKGLAFAVVWFLSSGFLPILPRTSVYLAALAGIGFTVVWRRRTRLAQSAVPTRRTYAFLFGAFVLSALPALTLAAGTPCPDGSSGRLSYLSTVFSAIVIGVFLTELSPRLRNNVAAFVLAIFAVQLFVLNLRWHAAGELNRSVLMSALRETDSERPTLVLCAPDSLYPALAFRSGLPEAVALWSGVNHRKRLVGVATTIFLYDPADDVAVTRDADSGRFLVHARNRRLPRGFPAFMESGSSPQGPPFTVTSIDAQTRRITPKPLPMPERLLIYRQASQGLVALPSPENPVP